MGEIWSNWAGSQSCAPALVARPRDEAQLCEQVRDAASRGRRVRAVGAGHSFTDCACTDGVMLDLADLRGVLDVDAASGVATVGAGTRLRDLGAQLFEHGLALENQGDIDVQTIAGAICTSTHGTGARLGGFAAQVEGVRLVRVDGSVLDVGSKDHELLGAARVSLGALGIVAAVKLRCVPRYGLLRRDAPAPLDDTLARLDELVDGNDHFEFFTFPYTTIALTRRMERVPDVPSPTPRARRFVQEELVENIALGAVCATGRRFPRRVSLLNRGLARGMSASEVIDWSHRIYPTHRAVRFNEMEYAIGREHAAAAIERVLALVRRRRLPILFPLEVRFAAPDDAFLSTAHGRATCYIAVHQYRGMEYESYFRAVEEIMDSFDGRPHWGKLHYQGAATLSARYPAWERFGAVRERLDPDRVFANDYTRRVLGP